MPGRAPERTPACDAMPIFIKDPAPGPTPTSSGTGWKVAQPAGEMHSRGHRRSLARATGEPGMPPKDLVWDKAFDPSLGNKATRITLSGVAAPC